MASRAANEARDKETLMLRRCLDELMESIHKLHEDGAIVD